MIKYKVVYTTQRIEEIEVEKETDDCVFIRRHAERAETSRELDTLLGCGDHEFERTAKKSEYCGFFDTFSGAYSDLLDNMDQNIKSQEKSLMSLKNKRIRFVARWAWKEPEND